VLPVSLNYWVIPGYAIFWGLSIIALALFLGRTYRLWRYLLLGRSWGEFAHVPRRMLTSLFHVVAQWCQFRTISIRDFAGVGHILMAWGFFVFVFYYFIFIIIGAGLGISGTLENTGFFYYYAWVMDIAAPFVVIAALWGIIRRYIIRPPRLKGEQTVEAMVILITVCIHPLTHLFKQATGIALGYPPSGLGFATPIISSALSQLFIGADLNSVQNANIGFFWAHWATVLFVLVYIAYSRYLHIIAAPFNILLRPSTPLGALSPVDFQVTDAFGVAGIRDLTRKQILECYSCVVCGRCQEVCPAYLSNKLLNPKEVVREIKRHLLRVSADLLAGPTPVSATRTDDALLGKVIDKDGIWACTTCGACTDVCPVCNDQPGIIIELRRRLVYEGIFDKGHQRALERVARDFNPWGIRWNNRAKNTGVEEANKEDKYDCIYWLGCVAAFDERVKETAQAMVKILKAAGLKFAMLGTGEKCCGDFVRRLGDEGLFQKLAEENISKINEFNFDFILTHCPHCYNTLKNEYPQYGGNFTVVHHTQLINSLLKDDKIQLQESWREPERVIYHDPCYLGRYNNIYEEPRQILSRISGCVVEFPRNRRNSFCCGAGGGSVWREQEEGDKIHLTRLEEGLMANPQTLATACPFCFLMFQEAIQLKGDGVKLRDIAEIVESRLRY